METLIKNNLLHTSFYKRCASTFFIVLAMSSTMKSQTFFSFDLGDPSPYITYRLESDLSTVYQISSFNLGREQYLPDVYYYKQALRFDCSSIPSYATVTEATFHFNSSQASGGLEAGSLKLTNIDKNFQSQSNQTVFNSISSGSQILTSGVTPYGNKSATSTNLKTAINNAVQAADHHIGIGAYNLRQDQGGIFSFMTPFITGTYSIPTPGIVRNLSVSSVTSSSCVLSWTSPAVSGGAGAASDYRIFKGDQEITSTTSTSITISGLCPNTTYSFTVQSHNTYGYGPTSNTGCTTSASYISGAYVLCSYGATYSAYNIPADANLSWTSSSNVSRTSAYNSNPCSFQGQDWGGAGTIYVNISSASCGTYQVNYSVWSGRPWIPTVYPSGNPAQLMGIYSPLDVAITSSPGANYYDINWSSSGALTTTCSCGSSGSFYSVSTGTGYFFATPFNACGDGVMYQGEVFVDGSISTIASSDSVSTDMILSPNPASEYLNIEVNIPELKNADKKYSIQIFDSFSRKIKEYSLSGQFNRINIQTLKTGQYYVKLVAGNKNFSKILIVK